MAYSHRGKVVRALALAAAIAALTTTVPASAASAAGHIPFGNVVAYTESPDGVHSHIRIVNVGKRHQYGLLKGSAPAWSRDGSRLAFVDPTGALTIRDSDGRLEHTGFEGLPQFVGVGGGAPVVIRWSPDGTRLVVTGGGNGRPFLHLIGTTAPYPTQEIGLQLQNGGFADPSWSPDGTRILYSPDDDLHVIDLAAGGADTVLTHDFARRGAAWSPDGSKIAYIAMPDANDRGTLGIYVMAADGSGARMVAPFSPVPIINPTAVVESQITWSPGSRQIAYVLMDQHDPAEKVWRLVQMNVDGSGRRILVASGTALGQPAWRP